MKKRILSIVLTLCMVLMLVPATVFAEGGTTPTYDLWQVDGKVYYAVTGEHTDFNTAGDTELPDWSNPVCYQFPSSGTYVLQTDITLTSSRQMIQFTTPDTTLELNGKTATSYNGTFSFICAENVTIQDSIGGGTINGNVSLRGNYSLTLKSGTIYELDIGDNGTFYADGGKIETNIEINHGTITQNNGTAGSEFNGRVDLRAATISGGVFYGTVGNGGGPKSGTISGGVFYGEVENKANSTISGGVFYGGIQDNGGTITDPYHTVSFDLNGASGTAPVTQYFVNTNTAQALEPATEPTREGYEFAGWYNGDTKYDFTENVTGNITLKAEWKSIEAPVITGLEDGKTYCDTVQFEVSDNVGVASVTANGDTLTPDANNKYTLEKGTGTVTVVAIDKANNQTSVTVTVNNGHTGGTATCTQKAKCGICGEEYGELTNHSLVKTDAKTPTCTEDGNIEYWTCSVCHKLFSDENGTNETTSEAVTVNATDHTFSGNTCTVCGYTKPSSGGGVSTYAITVENAENGTVTMTPKTASKGTTVTLTVEPDKGYTLETLTVTDRSGNEIELTNKGDGKYTFKMPASKVCVEATFMEDNSMLNFFVDVFPGDYYYDAVLWAAENGITGGVDDTHFAPNAPCTRAQIVTFLWRAAGSPVVNYAMNFSDVSADAYYAEAVRWAVSQGITTGTGDGTTFSPNATCTRAQAMTFIYRSEQARGGGMQGGWMFLNPFSDVDLESYYGEAVMWAVANGVTSGTTDTTFSPASNCTRAQIVTFLYRCLG